jgi:hypothetical protein
MGRVAALPPGTRGTSPIHFEIVDDTCTKNALNLE